MEQQLELISHQIDNARIHQRIDDGYVNATAMCKAVGKKFNDYIRLSTTQDFLEELARSAGIPADLLIVSITTGCNDSRGTWVYPDVAIHLGQWCSPKFAVAVSRWVREWMTGQAKAPKLPYHLRRYVANMNSVPVGRFSMLNEMIVMLVGPMEGAGYTLPENMLPDISQGRMFCKWLREEHGIDTDALPTYTHKYEDGREVPAKAYPEELLPEFRKHFREVWLPKKAQKYFEERDPSALPYLQPLLLENNGPANKPAAPVGRALGSKRIREIRQKMGDPKAREPKGKNYAPPSSEGSPDLITPEVSTFKSRIAAMRQALSESKDPNRGE